jgi:DNA-binding beta-propeller fold protein YncE
MARRSVKKATFKSGKAVLGLSPKDSGGISFKKFFILILIVLGALYVPSFLKNSFQAKPNDFLLKKVAQFKVNPDKGKTFFVTSVAAVAPGELAVTDCPGDQVLIYDFQGNLIRKWGKKGAGPTDLNEPSGIVTDRKGNLYVLDTWNGAVKVFDLKGNMERILDLAHFGFFYGPRQIGWGGNSFLVPNPSNFRLARISPAGELQGLWQGEEVVGKASAAIGDGRGRYYVGDTNLKKSRVRVLDESGKVLQTIKTGVAASGLALDSKGRLFVGCYGDSSRVFDADGKLLGVLTDEDEIGKPLNLFYGIDITADDMILTCAGEMVTIYKVSGEKAK